MEVNKVIEVTEDGKKIRQRIPMTGVRKIIAQNLTESWTSTVTTTGFVKYDCSGIRDYKMKMLEQGFKISYTDIFIMLTAAAIKKSPLVNSSLVDKKIEVYESINMGVAVTTDAGMLLVPVLHDIQDKSVLMVSQELKDVSKRVREGRITQTDLTGGTFTISSLGMYDTYAFSQVLSGHQSFILGFGAIRNEPVALEDGTIAVLPMIYVSASLDHRIIHGAPGAEFMKALGDGFKNPESYMGI